MTSRKKIIGIVALVLITFMAFMLGRATAPEYVYVDEKGNISTEKKEKLAEKPSKSVLSGAGTNVTDTFHLNEGAAKFHMTYEGSVLLSAVLVDSDGKTVALLISEAGKPVDASTIENINKAGNYSIKVESDGLWAITVEQQ